MASNNLQQTTNFYATDNHTIGYLRLLRMANFKKIRVEYRSGGIIRMEKLNRDIPFHGEPDGIVNQIRNGTNNSAYGLVDDINHNAMLGWLGPGTYPCHSSRCQQCPYVGRSGTVNLGPAGQLQLTKRASCATRNVVYVGVCRQCEEENSFACYFGESSAAFGRRCKEHHTTPCNPRSLLKSLNADDKRAEVARVLAAGVDPDEILRDWFAHVTQGGIHPGHQRMSVVDVIPHPFLRKNRERNLVAEYMFRNGDFDYRGMGRGCLNIYAAN